MWRSERGSEDFKVANLLSAHERWHFVVHREDKEPRKDHYGERQKGKRHSRAALMTIYTALKPMSKEIHETQRDGPEKLDVSI